MAGKGKMASKFVDILLVGRGYVVGDVGDAELVQQLGACKVDDVGVDADVGGRSGMHDHLLSPEVCKVQHGRSSWRVLVGVDRGGEVELGTNTGTSSRLEVDRDYGFHRHVKVVGKDGSTKMVQALDEGRVDVNSP